jgi:hypothetical protein
MSPPYTAQGYVRMPRMARPVVLVSSTWKISLASLVVSPWTGTVTQSKS